MNKKAVELNIATIIVVILAVIVLVILALYFTGGMQELWKQITGVAGTYDTSEVSSARQLCTTYCVINDEQSFCVTEFNLRKGDATEKKFCNQNPIDAHKSPECTNFENLDCSQYRTSE